MKLPDVRGTALVIAVFLSGTAVGALVTTRILHQRRDGAFEGREGGGMDRMLLRAIDRRVALDESQRKRVAQILTEAHRERRRIVAPVEGELEELRHRSETRIREALREDQRAGFDAFTATMAERHRSWGPPPEPPPPRPD